jgi:glutamyl-tRNA reductase
VEIYAATRNPERTKDDLKRLISWPGEEGNNVRFLSSADSVRHLARVAAGIDSMIIGEDQILSQVKEAHELGLKEKTIGPTLGEAFRKCLSIGKKVRSETGVDKGSVSIGSAAVELAEELLPDFQGRTILIVGAGEISKLVAKAIARHHVNAIFVANRTYDDAVSLANELGGQAVHFDKLHECLRKCDVLICGTAAPHIIIDKSDLQAAFGDSGPTRPLLLIDISNPRNIGEDVRELGNVTLRDLDGLRDVAERNAQRRRSEAKRAEELIDAELNLMTSRMRERRFSEDAIRALHSHIAELRKCELQKAMNRLNGVGERDRVVIEEMLASFTKKLLDTPTRALREASKTGDMQLIGAAERLFDLEKRRKS